MARPEATPASSARSPPVQSQVESNQQVPNEPLHQQVPFEPMQAPNFPPRVNTPPQIVHPGSGPNQVPIGNFAPHPVQFAAQGYHQPPQGYLQAPPPPPQPVQFVAGAPQVPIQLATPTSLWQTGLFDCLDDPLNAIITCCLPCFTFGQIAEILDQGNTSCATSGILYGLVLCLIGCPCLMSCSYRTKLRSKFSLIETPAPDWLTHCLCEHCALCQEYRELQKRGLDPAIGWHANVAKNQTIMAYQMAMMPPVHQNMSG